MKLLTLLKTSAHQAIDVRRKTLEAKLALLDQQDELIDEVDEATLAEVLELVANFGGPDLTGIPDLADLSDRLADVAVNKKAPDVATPTEPAPSEVLDPPPPDPNFDAQPAALAQEHIDLVHQVLSRQGDRVRQSEAGLVNQLPELGAEVVSAAVDHLVSSGVVERVGEGVVRVLTQFVRSAL